MNKKQGLEGYFGKAFAESTIGGEINSDNTYKKLAKYNSNQKPLFYSRNTKSFAPAANAPRGLTLLFSRSSPLRTKSSREIPVADAHGVLGDDGPLVQGLRHIMAGSANHLHPFLIGLQIWFLPAKAGKKE